MTGNERAACSGKLPWYAWYPGDFLSSTRGMPLAATGAYRALLDAQWDLGALPKFARELRPLTGATPSEFRTAWRYIESKFPVGSDGRRRNLRLEEHRRRAMELQEGRRRASAAGNAKRWGVANTDAPLSLSDPSAIAKGSPPQPQPQAHPHPEEPDRKARKRASVEPAGSTSSLVEEVFEFWQFVHKHPGAQLDKKRRRAIAEALKSYTVQQLKDCIEGYLNSRHHQGENAQGVMYTDIELMLRDASHIETGLRLKAHPPRPPKAETAMDEILRLNSPDDRRVIEHGPLDPTD